MCGLVTKVRQATVARMSHKAIYRLPMTSLPSHTSMNAKNLRRRDIELAIRDSRAMHVVRVVSCPTRNSPKTECPKKRRCLLDE